MNFNDIALHMEKIICGERGIPGCDMIVMQNHRTLFRHTCGFADREAGIPLPGDALYYMYSCTKPVTVTAAMRLVESGLLELDAPVSRYLPEFGNMNVKSANGVRPAKNVMTVRHLFTMSGGFDYNIYTPAMAEFLSDGKDRTTREIVKSFAARALDFEPGEQYQYSLCHDVLAAVVEAVTGERFGQYVKRCIFDPLGMSESYLRENKELHDRVSKLYRFKDGAVHPEVQKNIFMITPSYESGGAGLITRIEDYARFADALASGGKGADGYSLLSRKYIDLMRTEQLTAYTMDSRFGCTMGPDYGYGLGVRTRIKVDGELGSVGEFGWDGAAGSFIIVDPSKQLSIVFTTHVLGWPQIISDQQTILRDMVYKALEK